MRPINKGDIPIVNGIKKTVSNHRNWRGDLIDRIGAYCFYCNIPIKDSPQVEHVIAQDIDPSKALDWDNLILACGACNRAKSNHPCLPTTHYLPEFHNTHLAFAYFSSFSSAAYVCAKAGNIHAGKANSTIQLCALDRNTTLVAEQVTDMRWKYRYEAMVKAELWRTEFNQWGHKQLSGFINLLRTAVEAEGFWSIWFDAFQDISDIRKMLVTQFNGTDLESFKPINFLPAPRSSRPIGDLI